MKANLLPTEVVRVIKKHNAYNLNMTKEESVSATLSMQTAYTWTIDPGRFWMRPERKGNAKTIPGSRRWNIVFQRGELKDENS